MRLIDADKLIENINEIYEGYMTDESGCVPYDFERIVDEQPIAYDIDKVVEELENLDTKAIDRYKGGAFGNWEGTDYFVNKYEAIEIVKRGGKE